MSEFEAMLKKTNEISEELMKSDIPWAKSVELYKEGMRLLKEAQKLLKEAKMQVQLIQKEEQ